MEEEKRLLYVAVTRAKEKLYLCYYIRESDSGLCRFISGEVMESINIVDAPPDTSNFRRWQGMDRGAKRIWQPHKRYLHTSGQEPTGRI